MGGDIANVGINYEAKTVFIRFRFRDTQQTQDFLFSADDGSLQALTAAVPNFAGLRVALLPYLQSLNALLNGSVT